MALNDIQLKLSFCSKVARMYQNHYQFLQTLASFKSYTILTFANVQSIHYDAPILQNRQRTMLYRI